MSNTITYTFIIYWLEEIQLHYPTSKSIKSFSLATSTVKEVLRIRSYDKIAETSWILN